MPLFYRTCIDDFKCLSSVDGGLLLFGNSSTKQLYKFLLENVVTQPRVINIFPSVNFKDVFHRLYNSFIDKYIRDVMFRLIHDILPVSYYMHNIGVYKNNKWIFCKIHIETISHLFYECAFVKPLVNIVKNFLNIISDNQFQQFNLSHIRFHSFPFVILCKETESLCLFLIALLVYIIWKVRCIVKFEKKVISRNRLILMYINQLIQRIRADFYRFSTSCFLRYWCTTELFCEIDNGELKLNVNV